MKRLIAVVFAMAFAASATTLCVHGTEPGPWLKMFGALGIGTASCEQADVVIIGPDSQLDAEALSSKRFVVVVGMGRSSSRLHFSVAGNPVPARHIHDEHAPGLAIFWSEAAEVPHVQLPSSWHVYAVERWSQTPVIAGRRTGQGGLLWVATEPGVTGMERYPYLPQALVDVGLQVSLRSNSLWAFFDSAYRIRADSEYLASRWRAAGISVLHVAAWHTMEPDAAADRYLQEVIEACHRHSILVYAWLELPHVSERFWTDHPAWREKTAIGQDAELDWRKLMNLQNTDCRQAVESQIASLLARFDWDGVNLAELYFESLEGSGNPARFTPMNQDVRSGFARLHGFDPKLLFDPASEHAAATHPGELRLFLDYRAQLASQLQTDWLDAMDRIRRSKPYLDVTLTHVDDRFEPGMRDALGADVARVLPVLRRHRSTLLIEDPATLWSLGPERYAKLAARYEELRPDSQTLAVDINIVDRYQDVYPTKKQTGVELLELVHQAATSFHQVALYGENSIEKQDLSLLSAAASASRIEQIAPDEWEVSGKSAAHLHWLGPAEVDGKPWPLQDDNSILVPAGRHRVTPGMRNNQVQIIDFNGEVESASSAGPEVNLTYRSKSRALARLAGPIGSLELDGAAISVTSILMLPPGQHLLTLHAKP